MPPILSAKRKRDQINNENKTLLFVQGVQLVTALGSLSEALRNLIAPLISKIEVSIEVAEISSKVKKDDVPFIVEAMCECGFKLEDGVLSSHNNSEYIKALTKACDMTLNHYQDLGHGQSKEFVRAKELSLLYHWMRMQCFGISTEYKWYKIHRDKIEIGKQNGEIEQTFTAQFLGTWSGDTFLWGSDNPVSEHCPKVKLAEAVRKGYETSHEIPEFQFIPKHNPEIPPGSLNYLIPDPKKVLGMFNASITAELLHRNALEIPRNISLLEKAEPYHADWHLFARHMVSPPHFERYSKVPMFFSNVVADLLTLSCLNGFSYTTNEYHAVLYLAKRLNWRIIYNKPGIKSDEIKLVLCPCAHSCKMPFCPESHVTLEFTQYFRCTKTQSVVRHEEKDAMRYWSERLKWFGPNDQIQLVL